jgi:hypothetical protein
MTISHTTSPNIAKYYEDIHVHYGIDIHTFIPDVPAYTIIEVKNQKYNGISELQQD